MARTLRPAGSVDIGLRVEACIAEDDEAAFAVMRRRVASRVLIQYPRWEYLNAIGLQLPDAFVEIAKRPDAKKAADEGAARLPRERSSNPWSSPAVPNAARTSWRGVSAEDQPHGTAPAGAARRPTSLMSFAPSSRPWLPALSSSGE